MKLASQFQVAAAPDKVFALFFDAETMRKCIPGCDELEQIDEKNYRGSLTNEVAHVKFRAGFEAEIQSLTESSDPGEPSIVRAILKGEDRRLGSTIKVDAMMKVAPQGDESLVSYELEVAMWGKLGRLGEPVIRRRSMDVEKQFATALTAVCAGEPIPQGKAKKVRRTEATTAPAAGVAPEIVTVDAAAPTSSPTTTDGAKWARDLRVQIAAALAVVAVGVVLRMRRRKH